MLARMRYGKWACALPGDYEAFVNQFGAVSVRTRNVSLLGLKLNEFEPIEWCENEKS